MWWVGLHLIFERGRQTETETDRQTDRDTETKREREMKGRKGEREGVWIRSWAECCVTSTETIGLLGTGAQDAATSTFTQLLSSAKWRQRRGVAFWSRFGCDSSYNTKVACANNDFVKCLVRTVAEPVAEGRLGSPLSKTSIVWRHFFPIYWGTALNIFGHVVPKNSCG